MSVCSLTNFIASPLYIDCLFTVVLFLYLPIVHLTPFLHYCLEPVSKHFTVYTCSIRRTWQINFDLIWIDTQSVNLWGKPESSWCVAAALLNYWHQVNGFIPNLGMKLYCVFYYEYSVYVCEHESVFLIIQSLYLWMCLFTAYWLCVSLWYTMCVPDCQDMLWGHRSSDIEGLLRQSQAELLWIQRQLSIIAARNLQAKGKVRLSPCELTSGLLLTLPWPFMLTLKYSGENKYLIH